MVTSLEQIYDELWEEACRREDVVRELFRLYPDGAPAMAVADACQSLSVSRATLFRLIERFKSQPSVSSLLPRKRGRAPGSKNADEARDRLIRQTIERLYLAPERVSFARLVKEVRLLCFREGLVAPSWRTVRARLAEIDIRTQALRRGDQRAMAATRAVPGEYRVSRPLEIVQLDHTRVDVVVVDEETREPVGRPWITLARGACQSVGRRATSPRPRPEDTMAIPMEPTL
jgi:putative transposase